MDVDKIHLTRISCERDYPSGWPKNVEVHTSATVRRISKSDNPKNNLLIDFLFTSEYVKLGSIKIEGEAVVSGKEILDDEEKGEVLTKIAHHCIVIASFLAKDMSMPPPVELPKFSPAKKKTEEGYIR